MGCHNPPKNPAALTWCIDRGIVVSGDISTNNDTSDDGGRGTRAAAASNALRRRVSPVAPKPLNI